MGCFGIRSEKCAKCREKGGVFRNQVRKVHEMSAKGWGVLDSGQKSAQNVGKVRGGGVILVFEQNFTFQTMVSSLFRRPPPWFMRPS